MMQPANQVRVERKEACIGFLSGIKPVATLCDIKIPSAIPSSPHVYKWMSIRGKVVARRYIVHCAVPAYLPLVCQRGVEKMKAEPCDNNQGSPTNGKRNYYVTHQPRR